MSAGDACQEKSQEPELVSLLPLRPRQPQRERESIRRRLDQDEEAKVF